MTHRPGMRPYGSSCNRAVERTTQPDALSGMNDEADTRFSAYVTQAGHMDAGDLTNAAAKHLARRPSTYGIVG